MRVRFSGRFSWVKSVGGTSRISPKKKTPYLPRRSWRTLGRKNGPSETNNLSLVTGYRLARDIRTLPIGEFIVSPKPCDGQDAILAISCERKYASVTDRPRHHSAPCAVDVNPHCLNSLSK